MDVDLIRVVIGVPLVEDSVYPYLLDAHLSKNTMMRVFVGDDTPCWPQQNSNTFIANFSSPMRILSCIMSSNLWRVGHIPILGLIERVFSMHWQPMCRSISPPCHLHYDCCLWRGQHISSPMVVLSPGYSIILGLLLLTMSPQSHLLETLTRAPSRSLCLRFLHNLVGVLYLWRWLVIQL